MDEHRCEVRIYKPRGACKFCRNEVLNKDCPQCRIGCFAIAMFKNPAFDPSGLKNGGLYNYAEWLCAEHYDEVMDMIRRQEADALEPWEEDIVNDEETDWDGESEFEGV